MLLRDHESGPTDGQREQAIRELMKLLPPPEDRNQGTWLLMRSPEISLHQRLIRVDIAGWRPDPTRQSHSDALDQLPSWVCLIVDDAVPVPRLRWTIRKLGREGVLHLWIIDVRSSTISVLAHDGEYNYVAGEGAQPFGGELPKSSFNVAQPGEEWTERYPEQSLGNYAFTPTEWSTPRPVSLLWNRHGIPRGLTWYDIRKLLVDRVENADLYHALACDFIHVYQSTYTGDFQLANQLSKLLVTATTSEDIKILSRTLILVMSGVFDYHNEAALIVAILYKDDALRHKDLDRAAAILNDLYRRNKYLTWWLVFGLKGLAPIKKTGPQNSGMGSRRYFDDIIETGLLRPEVLRVAEALYCFISYKHDDYEDAVWLYHRLRELGVNTWMDSKDLHVGHRWEDQILSVLKKTSAFVACYTRSSLATRGYFDKEVSLAIAAHGKKQINAVIPVTFDRIELPTEVASFQAIDLSSRSEGAITQLHKAIMQNVLDFDGQV